MFSEFTLGKALSAKLRFWNVRIILLHALSATICVEAIKQCFNRGSADLKGSASGIQGFRWTASDQ